MLKRARQWWERSGWIARGALALGALVVTGAVLTLGLLVFLLRPADSIDRYGEYEHDDQAPAERGEVSITFFGVSTILFDDGITKILIDSFFSRPDALESLTSVSSDAERVSELIDEFAMHDVSAIFVAHSHHDHALDVAAVANATGTKVYGTESTLNIGRGGGVDESQLVLTAPGESYDVGWFSVQVQASPHSVVPGVVPPDTPPVISEPFRLPASLDRFAEGGNFNFILAHGSQSYVIVASANYRQGALASVDADVLLLGTALLGTQDRGFQTAYLEETIGATTPEIIIPLHWDDFVAPWERGRGRFNPRLIDAEPARGFDLVIAYAKALGARFVLLRPGSRIVVPG